MIDSLVSVLKRIDQSYEDRVFHKFGLERDNFVLVTLHRPCNVDDTNNLRRIMKFLEGLSLKYQSSFRFIREQGGHSRCRDRFLF